LEVTKIVRAALHYAFTKPKLSVLEQLTGMLSCCVWVFSKLIEERNMNVEGYGEFCSKDIAEIEALTKLQALWMWRASGLRGSSNVSLENLSARA